MYFIYLNNKHISIIDNDNYLQKKLLNFANNI